MGQKIYFRRGNEPKMVNHLDLNCETDFIRLEIIRIERNLLESETYLRSESLELRHSFTGVTVLKVSSNISTIL